MPTATWLILILISLALSSCGPTQWQLDSVADGRTLSAQRNGQVVRLQMCGVGPTTDQATSHLIDLLEQHDQVASIDEISRSGRQVLAEVFMSDTESEILLSEELLVAGLAQPESLEDCPNQSALALAAQIAQEEGLGVWAED